MNMPFQTKRLLSEENATLMFINIHNSGKAHIISKIYLYFVFKRVTFREG